MPQPAKTSPSGRQKNGDETTKNRTTHPVDDVLQNQNTQKQNHDHHARHDADSDRDRKRDRVACSGIDERSGEPRSDRHRFAKFARARASRSPCGSVVTRANVCLPWIRRAAAGHASRGLASAGPIVAAHSRHLRSAGVGLDATLRVGRRDDRSHSAHSRTARDWGYADTRVWGDTYKRASRCVYFVALDTGVRCSAFYVKEWCFVGASPTFFHRLSTGLLWVDGSRGSFSRHQV